MKLLIFLLFVNIHLTLVASASDVESILCSEDYHAILCEVVASNDDKERTVVPPRLQMINQDQTRLKNHSKSESLQNLDRHKRPEWLAALPKQSHII